MTPTLVKRITCEILNQSNNENFYMKTTLKIFKIFIRAYSLQFSFEQFGHGFSAGGFAIEKIDIFKRKFC